MREGFCGRRSRSYGDLILSEWIWSCLRVMRYLKPRFRSRDLETSVCRPLVVEFSEKKEEM